MLRNGQPSTNDNGGWGEHSTADSCYSSNKYSRDPVNTFEQYDSSNEYSESRTNTCYPALINAECNTGVTGGSVECYSYDPYPDTQLVHTQLVHTQLVGRDAAPSFHDSGVYSSLEGGGVYSDSGFSTASLDESFIAERPSTFKNFALQRFDAENSSERRRASTITTGDNTPTSRVTTSDCESFDDVDTPTSTPLAEDYCIVDHADILPQGTTPTPAATPTRHSSSASSSSSCGSIESVLNLVMVPLVGLISPRPFCYPYLELVCHF